MHPILSWLHDAGRLTLRYILVGFAFVPAGLGYVEVTRLGHGSVVSMSLFLAVGFLCANIIWKSSATKATTERVPVVSQALAKALVGPTEQLCFAMEGPEDARFLSQLLRDPMVARHVILVLKDPHSAPEQRPTQAIFQQQPGALHAAFSSLSSYFPSQI